jgi:hypothetical protein
MESVKYQTFKSHVITNLYKYGYIFTSEYKEEIGMDDGILQALTFGNTEEETTQLIIATVKELEAAKFDATKIIIKTLRQFNDWDYDFDGTPDIIEIAVKGRFYSLIGALNVKVILDDKGEKILTIGFYDSEVLHYDKHGKESLCKFDEQAIFNYLVKNTFYQYCNNSTQLETKIR